MLRKWSLISLATLLVLCKLLDIAVDSHQRANEAPAHKAPIQDAKERQYGQ